jgi:hypothetical protein
MRDKKGVDLMVDVPVVQELVGADVQVSRSPARTSELTFRGSAPLTIAAKAAQLKVDERGFWVSERPVASGEIRGLGRAHYLTGDEIRLT